MANIGVIPRSVQLSGCVSVLLRMCDNVCKCVVCMRKCVNVYLRMYVDCVQACLNVIVKLCACVCECVCVCVRVYVCSAASA